MNAINWHTFFFLLFALLACGFAVAVVAASNIVRMAVCLVVSLGAVAGLFFLAGADFVGAMQLMVYVGGTMVLLIFGVMLTSRGPLESMKTGRGELLLAAGAGGCLLAVLLYAAFSVDEWAGGRPAVSSPAPTATGLGMGLLGLRVDGQEGVAHGADEIAPSVRSGYLLAFEIVSVHLLVVLVGAAFLARTKRRVAAASDANPQATAGEPSRD